MAVEKNPYDVLKSNVIPMDIGIEEESAASIEVDDDGGVIVRLWYGRGSNRRRCDCLGEWYDDLCGEIDEDELSNIANQVYNNYQSDKDSRGEWEDMFERGFDLLGLKTSGCYRTI